MSSSAARALLDQLRQLDESDRIEAKRASAIGESLLETVCAFANEPGLGGGWLLLGVIKGSGTPCDYQVMGIEDPDKLLNDLHSRCANAFNVPVRIQARAEALEEGTVIVVEVPEAGDEQRALIFFRETHPKGLPSESGALHRESESLSKEFLLSELPDPLRRQIEALGQRSRDTGRLGSAILALCALRPRSLRELAAATEPNPAYLQHRYITPLVRKDQLKCNYPDELNRPDQTCLAAEEQQ